MFVCVGDIGRVCVCWRHRSCLCVLEISFLLVSTILLFDCGIVPILWYVFSFHFIIYNVRVYQKIGKRASVAQRQIEICSECFFNMIMMCALN